MDIPVIPYEQKFDSALLEELKQWVPQINTVLCRTDVSEQKKEAIVTLARSIQSHAGSISETEEIEKKTRKRLEGMMQLRAEFDDDLVKSSSSVSEAQLKNREVDFQIKEINMKITSARNEAQFTTARMVRFEDTNARLRDCIKKDIEATDKTVENLKVQLKIATDVYERSPYTLRQQKEKQIMMELAERKQRLLSEEISLDMEKCALTKEMETCNGVSFARFVQQLTKQTLRSKTLLDTKNAVESEYRQCQEKYKAELASGTILGEFDISQSFEQDPLSVSQILNTQATCKTSSQPPNDVRPPATTEVELAATKHSSLMNYVDQQMPRVEGSTSDELSRDDNDPDTDLSRSRDENDRDSVTAARMPDEGNDMEVVSSNEEENENTERPEDNVNETVLEDGEDGSAVPEDEDDHRMEDQVEEVDDECDNTLVENEEDAMDCSQSQPPEANQMDLDNHTCASQDIDQGDTHLVEQASQLTEAPSEGPDAVDVAPELDGPQISQPDSAFDVSASPAANSKDSALGGVSDLFQESTTANVTDFDAAAVLDISMHSNDPAGDFLSMMQESTNKEAGAKTGGAGDAEFSFSMFGAAEGDGGAPSAGGSGEFAFNFGAGSPPAGTGNSSFNFNFGGDSADAPQENGGGDGGFFFGF